MSLKDTWFRTKLKKKATQGFHGYPVATIAYYGPDDLRATKVAVGIVPEEGGEVAFVERWFDADSDVRRNAQINEEIVHFLEKHGVKSVAMADRILGCPHEEGIDYPDGVKCPQCSFWANRDRFTGQVIQ
jgi:hypothetical protein